MKLKWKVGLSDGTNYIEGNSPFQYTDGELSPWLKLQRHIKENNLSITSLCIVDEGRTFNLPSRGQNPKFRAFLNAEKPIAFNFFRMIGGAVGGGNRDLFAVAEAHYTDYKLQLWVDEKNTKNCWVLMV
jgi:hypothetical protein